MSDMDRLVGLLKSFDAELDIRRCEEEQTVQILGQNSDVHHPFWVEPWIRVLFAFDLDGKFTYLIVDEG